MLLDKLNDKRLPPEQRIDIRMQVRQLTVSDWVLIARAFDAWPFAPEVRRPTCHITKPPTNLLAAPLTAIGHRLFRSLRTGLIVQLRSEYKCAAGVLG